MKPQIFIDARMIGMGGIGRYTASLLEAMMAESSGFEWTLVGEPHRLETFARKGARIRECRAGIYSAREAFGIARHFEDADLVHIPHFNAPLGLKAPVVVTLHDLIHFDFPEYQPFPFANWILDLKLRNLLGKASAVIAVSGATAEALRARYPSVAWDGKLDVVWEGVEACFANEPVPDDASRRSKFGLAPEEPYVLYVGAIREHKNVQVLLQAFEALRQQQPDLKARLVLCGRLHARFEQKWNFSQRVERSGGAVLHVPDATDRDLAAFYRGSSVSVMPSLAEGFGLPLIEAMRSGAPVIAGDIPVLREIGHNAALYFEPGRVDALSGLLYNVLSDAALRRRLSQDGLDRSREFQWPLAARQTLKIYERILKNV